MSFAATDGLFFETAKEVAKQYPDIQMDDANIDAMTMWLLKNPFNYDVLVAPNLYGDIISDLCAQMVGGLGFGCSGNIGTSSRSLNQPMAPLQSTLDWTRSIRSQPSLQQR